MVMMMMMRSVGGGILRRGGGGGRTLLVASSRVSHLPPTLPLPLPLPSQHQSSTSLPHISSPFTSLRFLSSSSSSSSAAAAAPAPAAPKKKVSADDKLRKVIQSEIECAESDDAQHQVVLPGNFPFQILDNPGEQTITLKRDIAGETILVEVHSPNMYDDEVADDDDDNQSDNDDNSDQFTISLTVTVLKGDGPRLEFSCTATPDQISIDTMIIKDPDTAAAAASLEHQILYEGPEFSDLDENLQKAFYTYLEDRGIKSSLTNFLQEYMNDKENREYLTWLKSMKEFVEK